MHAFPLIILCVLNYVLFIQEWEKIHIKNKESGPVGRTDHSAVCLGYNGCHPNLLIIGGLNNHKKVLNDIWTLDVRAERWKKVGRFVCIT